MADIDDLALRRIINVPKRSIGATTVERVADYAQMRGISLFDAMTQADQIMSLGRGAGKLAPFVRMIRDFREKSKDCTIAELIGEIVEQTQYPEYLRNEDDESAEDRLSNIDELITKAVAYEESHETPSLSDCLE